MGTVSAVEGVGPCGKYRQVTLESLTLKLEKLGV